MPTPVFIILAILSLFSGLMVVFSKNPIYSVIWLVVCFLTITGHYILLSADFLAVVNIIVYAGAIMVLFLYVIMLLNLNKESEPGKSPIIKGAVIISGTLLMLVLTGSFRDFYSENPGPLTDGFGTAKAVGKILFTEFLLPFEVASLLFISAMVGAVILGKKHVND